MLRRKGQCKTKVKVNLLDDVERLNEHTHPLSDTTCQVVPFKSQIKGRAKNVPQKILADTLANA